MSSLFQLTKLDPSKTFVDLGSGVSNCLIQASLASGCKSYGAEIQPAAAEMGLAQVEEAKNRWLMYGLKGGDMTALKSDFIQDPAIAQILQKADVLVRVLYLLSVKSGSNLLYTVACLFLPCYVIK